MTDELRGFRAGHTAELVHVVTREDVDRFAELTGDNNPLHVDRAFAERTSFKGVVAHGMLSASFISTIIGTRIPGEGALWVSQTLEFLLPVRIGDRLSIRAEVTHVHVGQRLLTLAVEITNQHGQRVLTGTGRVKVLEIDDEAAAPGGDARERRVVIVTGASRGIGAATARRLARDGFAVVANYNTDRDGAEAVVRDIEAGGGEALAVQADVSDPRAVEKLVGAAVRRFGTVTALVNNATGRYVLKPFAELAPEDLDYYLDIQFKAPLALIRAVLPHFEAAGAGAVVNVATTAVDGAPPAQVLAYAASKAALVSATRSLAVEYGPRGFRFNLVSPGMTDTGLIADIPEKARVITRMQTPLRRLADPADVANAIAFLLGDQARHLTGETLRVAGGAVML